PDWLAGDAIEDIEHSLFGWLRHRFDSAAVHRDVGENRRAGNVHVPDAVVDELVVPFACSCLQVDRNEALAEQAAAGAMASVVVASRHLNRQVRQPEIFVNGDLPPYARIPGVDPRVLFPCVVAELAELRDGVEDPEALAGPDIEAADVPFHVLKTLRVRSGPARGADDDDVPGHHGRRMQSDLAVHRIDDLVVVELQIDDAAAAEVRLGDARFRVQRDEAVAWRHVQHALFAAIGPVRQAAARQLPRRRGAAWPFLLAVHPDLFTGCRIQ